MRNGKAGVGRRGNREGTLQEKRLASAEAREERTCGLCVDCDGYYHSIDVCLHYVLDPLFSVTLIIK